MKNYSLPVLVKYYKYRILMLIGTCLLAVGIHTQAQVLIKDTVSIVRDSLTVSRQLRLSAQSRIGDTSNGRSRLSESNVRVPIIDTVLKLMDSDTSSWQYKMEQSDDKWLRMKKTKDFQTFLKYDWGEAKKTNLSPANISYYGNATLIWLNNIPGIELAAAGINAQNAGDFIYHVVVNDSVEIVPWSKPANFRTNKNITYAYLGKINTQNKIVKLEIYNIKDYHDRSVYIFNNLYMPAPLVKRVVLNYNNKFLFKPFMQHYIPYNRHHYFQWEKQQDSISFNWSDSINHILIEMKNTIQNDMYSVYLKRIINEKTDTAYISNNWQMSHYSPDPELRINSSYFNKAGKYEIIVVPEAPDDFKIKANGKAVIIPFMVLPATAKLFTGSQVSILVGLILLLALILFLIYYSVNKRRSAKEAQQKEIATLQLQSVRSQLNPHFMFNALAGIQNLMNKGDIKATNLYLSKFSRITRNVLDDKNKEVIPITEEVSLLEDYLQMEQMRFGFNYNIRVDEKIDRDNTEIPAMLLQPYIENAVKHGVSTLKYAGMIAIAIMLKSGNLVLEVKDNGKGYDTNAKTTGHGTILSEKRVDLINQINKGNSISISKKSDSSGTIISIELNNWV